MQIKHITAFSEDLPEIENLYKRAFPPNERKPLKNIVEDSSGVSDMIAFYDRDIFCGFAILLDYKDISHITYFAIEDNLRDEGYGSQALEAIKEVKKGKRIIVDIEMERADAPNSEQRKIRRKFYFRNGYKDTEVVYDWCGDTYEILCYNGTVTTEEFEQFWKGVRAKNKTLEGY